MRIVLILFTTGLLIVFANAQRKANFTKPVVNLDKRPRPPMWHRPPEERRKLSIFPKNNIKFVVTPKTTVKNEEEAKEGLPTKRPLMRKFVMQNRNDRGTWSFAPREPLMKSKRFTVTLAPPKLNDNKDIDELTSDESRKVKTVVSNLKTERESNKINKLNKGNLIQMVQIKKATPLSTKTQRKIEPSFKGDKVLELNNVNESQHLNTMKSNDSKTRQTDEIADDNVTHERSSNNHVTILNANETKDEKKNDESDKFNQTSVKSNEEDDLKDLAESKAVDLDDMELEDHNKNNSLIINNEKSTKNNLEPVKNLNELEDSLAALFQNSQARIVSDTNLLKNENITESVVDSLILSDVEGLITFIEQQAVGMKNHEISAGEPNVQDQRESIDNDDDELELDIVETYTERPTTNGPIEESVNNNNLRNNDSRDDTLEPSGEFNSNDSFNSKEVSLEEQASSTHLNNDKNLMELSLDKDDVSNEATIAQSNLTAEEIDSSSNYTGEEISNEYISDVSNSFTEEHSKESSFEKSNNLIKDISNESSSNMAVEELSNESYVDKSSNLTEEGSNYFSEGLSNESPLDKSNDEEKSNESSSNMAAEELSNESYFDRSNNLTEEGSNYFSEDLSNQSPLDKSNDEEKSNESSSNMAVEELSNESYVDKSNNLTEEVSNESTGRFTDEEILSESIEKYDVVIDEGQSYEPIVSSQNSNYGEIPEEALRNRFRRSNNMIEEENQATTFSGFKYTGQEIRLNHNLNYKNINA